MQKEQLYPVSKYVPCLEKWKPLNGFPKYEISSKGRVRTIRHKRLIKSRLKMGDKYLKFSLGAGKAGRTIPKRVHRLVGLHFVDGYKPGLHINHEDGNRLNNNHWNLRWCTQQENNDHSYHVLGNKSPMLSGGHVPPNKKMNDELLKKCLELYAGGMTTNKIGIELGLEGGNIRRHLRKYFENNRKVA